VGQTGGSRGSVWLPFLAGIAAGVTGAVLSRALAPRRGLDVRLFRSSREDPDLPPVVFVPGILGSELADPDGLHVWLNLRNALGHYDLALPLKLPFSESRDGLRPAGLLGVDRALPRLFGFTEYADFVSLVEGAGFSRDRPSRQPGASHHVFTYDWRRDLVESVGLLHDALERLADERGEPELRVNLVAHSMGGLIARYYMRYGVAEPGGPVTWAGARRIRRLVLVATPNAGGMPALDAILNGSRVGFSYATLASHVTERMPAIYQLLPPAGSPALLDGRGNPMDCALHDPATWERFGWGPFGKMPARRRYDAPRADPDARKAFVTAALERGRAFWEALNRAPAEPCPARVLLLGGDCLPTLGRALVGERPGQPPRFLPETRAQAELMLEAGDGRVTRASTLAAHLADAEGGESACGVPEVSQVFIGAADHHGIYDEPTFQSVLLRTLLMPAREAVATAGPAPADAEPVARAAL
jgi:pimeloyl-ACP methyl ester carboxylesterase